MPGDWAQVNFTLLDELAVKPHRLLNIPQREQTADDGWEGEVLQEARTSHHLLDMLAVPAERGYKSDLDARTYLAVRKILDLQQRLDRIQSWHAREAGPAGTVGDFCTECGHVWPCDSRRMADGTYEDQPSDDEQLT